MNRSIPLCAIGLFIAFFLPWLSFKELSISGFQLARGVQDYAGKGTGLSAIFWLWLLPVLAFVTAVSGGKGGFGRVMAIVSGAYPWGWLAYGYFEVGRTAGKEASRFLQEGLWQVAGFGVFATLGCAGALLALGMFRNSDSEA